MSESRQNTGLSVASLNTDEVAVYRAVFYQWNSDGRILSVSDRTLPLASGRFSRSEIVFDQAHSRALVSYAFVGGSFCGNRGTWLLEKVDGVWKIKDRDSGGWVSWQAGVTSRCTKFLKLV